MIKNILASITLTFLCTQVFASNPHYSIIIDAGSSSSKLYLFKYEYTENSQLPIITGIYADKAKPGISSYENDPEAAGAGLKTMLDNTTAKLASLNIDPKFVKLNIMATAGMRLIPQDKQKAIYRSIKTFVTNNTNYSIGKIETISGKMEGLYGWLDVNFLNHSFDSKKQKTVGILDMGGASTEIAFQTNDHRFPADETTIKINGKIYNIFSKSFLGLGQNQARASLGEAAAPCYPTNYAINGHLHGDFNFPACSKSYSTIIDSYNISTTIPQTDNMPFVAYSGFYYTTSFLKVSAQPSATELETSITNLCQQPWDKLKAAYPNEADEYLSAYCANGTYIDNLLYHHYHMSDSQVTVTDKINNESIDWVLGALLHQLLS